MKDLTIQENLIFKIRLQCFAAFKEAKAKGDSKAMLFITDIIIKLEGIKPNPPEEIAISQN